MIAIIDYGMGNVASVQKAIRKLGFQAIITSDLIEIKNARYLILPGVGSFREAMKNLKEKKLDTILKEEVLNKKKPILGICLGMQLLASAGYEDGHADGLGLIAGNIVKIESNNLPIPHIGWNNVQVSPNPFFNAIVDDNFYFVHSYVFEVERKEDRLGIVQYESDLTAIVWKENILGTQFHPEKSQTSGLQLLKNFLDYYA